MAKDWKEELGEILGEPEPGGPAAGPSGKERRPSEPDAPPDLPGGPSSGDAPVGAEEEAPSRGSGEDEPGGAVPSGMLDASAGAAGPDQEPDGAGEETAPDDTPPVAVFPEQPLEHLTAEGGPDDPRRRTGFSLAVEDMFHELVNQIGQVKELAKRKKALAKAAETEEEEKKFLREEEEGFFHAVEKMFADIRENFAHRMEALKKQERETLERLEKTRIALEVRQQEIERLRAETESARARVRELENEMAALKADTSSRPDEDYVRDLESRLNQAYSLLKAIEETYLALDGGAPPF